VAADQSPIDLAERMSKMTLVHPTPSMRDALVA